MERQYSHSIEEVVSSFLSPQHSPNNSPEQARQPIGIDKLVSILKQTMPSENHRSVDIVATSHGLSETGNLRDYEHLIPFNDNPAFSFSTPQMEFYINRTEQGVYEVQFRFLDNAEYKQDMSSWKELYPRAMTKYPSELQALKQFYSLFADAYRQKILEAHRQVNVAIQKLSPVGEMRMRFEPTRTSVVLIDAPLMAAQAEKDHAFLEDGPYSLHIDKRGVVVLKQDYEQR